MSTQLLRRTAPPSMQQESRTYFRALGKRVTDLRKSQGMTQAELARLLGVSQQTMFSYELGDRRVSVLRLHQLAKLLRVSAEELMGFTPAESAAKRPSPQWMRHAERLQGLSKSAQRFVIKMIDVLEDRAREHRQ